MMKASLKCLFRRHVEDERGGITILMLVMLLGLVFMIGFAMDLMRHESERAALQNALDRGILSATSLTQTQDPETIIGEYLEDRPISGGTAAFVAQSTGSLTTRKISAEAGYTMNTLFLRLAGLNELPVAARAGAEEGVKNVEVSLALDISGSMARERSNGTTESRLEVLRGAAQTFVDQILNADTEERTSISLVPYAGQVNAGPFFNTFASGLTHNFSQCLDFQPGDFNGTALPKGNRGQTPHFQWFTFEGDRGHEAEWGWCPSNDQALVPVSNNAAELKAEIAGFMGHDGTGTQNGMKWALALLDPDTQPMIDSFYDQNIVASANPGAGISTVAGADFDDRPSAFDDNDTLKFVVLMTDGNIRYQQRPLPIYYNSASEVAYFASNKLRAKWATLDTEAKEDQSEAQSTSDFLALCQLAEDNEVTVFTIGFDISETSSAYNEMRNCASTPGHFFHVQGLELETAFQQIAATIQQLRLVN